MPTPTTTVTVDPKLLANLKVMRDRVHGNQVTKPAPEPVAAPLAAALTTAEDDTVLTVSKLWGMAKGTLPDFDITGMVKDLDSVPKNVLALVPKVEQTYVPQGTNEYMFTRAMAENQRVLLCGPMGSGKSTMPKQFAALTNRPFTRFQAQRTTEAEDMFGNLSVLNGNVVWVDGPVTTMARVGGVVCVDEVSVLQAGAAMALQWLIEPNGKVSLPNYPSENPEDKLVTPHPDFRIVFTDNTTLAGDSTGQYVGTNVQNAAFRDRIDLTIRVRYMGQAQEAEMVQRHVPSIPAAVLTKMVQFATEIRAGYEKGECDCTVSPRVLLRWAKDTTAFGDIGLALCYNYVNALSPDDATVVGTLYTKVFGTRLPNV